MRRTSLLVAAAIVCAAGAANADADPTAPPAAPPPSAAPAADNDLPTFEKTEPKQLPPQLSLLFGLRGGPLLAGGDLAPSTHTDFGMNIGVDVGARFFRQFYGGLTFDGAMMFAARDTLSQQSANVAAFGFAVMGGWLSHPEKVGLFAQLGLGTHIFAVSTQTGRGDSHASVEVRTAAGLSFSLASVRLVLPRVDLAAGGADGLGHAIVTVGLSAAYEIELFKHHR